MYRVMKKCTVGTVASECTGYTGQPKEIMPTLMTFDFDQSRDVELTPLRGL